MKYAIAGAFSTGKTTLADKLESYGFTVVKDVERKVIDILGKPQDLDAPALRNFQNRIFFEQMFNEVDNKGLTIHDNSLPTSLAYCKNTLDPEFFEYNFHSIEKFLEKKPYTAVFYLPATLPIKDDGMRYVDPIFQEKISQDIKTILDDLKIRCITIDGDIRSRLLQILNIITSDTLK